MMARNLPKLCILIWIKIMECRIISYILKLLAVMSKNKLKSSKLIKKKLKILLHMQLIKPKLFNVIEI
jgi:hypothetical protein